MEPPSHLTPVCETTRLADLVIAAKTVPQHATVEDVHDLFGKIRDNVVVVLAADQTYLGLVSRQSHAALLSSQYGFSLYRASPIVDHLAPNVLVLPAEATLAEAAEKAFVNELAPDLKNDAVVIDNDRKVCGIITAKDLVHYQWLLSRDQAKELETLRHKLQDRYRTIDSQNERSAKTSGLDIRFDNAILGIAITAPDGTIEAHNDRFQEITEVSPESTEHNFFDLFSDEQKKLLSETFRRLEDTRSARIEAVMELGPDLLREISGIAFFVGETGKIIVQIDDITKRRKFERQMASQEKNLLLNTLIDGVAYEINSKLSPVLGFAQIYSQAKEITDLPEIREAFTLISDCATESSETVERLLQLSKPPTFTKAVCDLCSLVEDTADFLRFQVREKGCNLIFQTPAAAPLLIEADRALLKQVMMNLIINAIHASEAIDDPTVTLEIDCDDEEAHISVSDSGCGISEENLKKIFEPFFTTKAPHGNGLGLSMCKSIMELHSGSLSAESELGNGTVMTLTLPLATQKKSI